MVWSGSLTPQPLALALCFVNNDCVTAEITYSTVHVPHEVLTWSRPALRASPGKPWLLQHWGYTGVASRLCYLRLCHGYVWRRQWQPTPVLLPRKSHGQRSLVGYSSWGRKESDTTERLHSLTHSFCTSGGLALLRQNREYIKYSVNACLGKERMSWFLRIK